MASLKRFSQSNMLHLSQKEGNLRLQRLTSDSFTKPKLTKYHYVWPVFQSTVASAVIFTVAGLAHVLENDPKKKDSASKLTECSLIAMNVVILGCWRFKGLQRFMETFFVHRVESSRPITLLSACFSHKNVLFHLVPNMFVLYFYLGPVQELTNRHEIVAVYLSSGMFGFAASHIYRFAQYRIYNQRLVPSLGASGSLMGIMAIAYSWLDNKTHEAKIGAYREVFLSTVISDVFGVICRWVIIDHAAHLGGAMFGFVYAIYGRDYIWHPLVDALRKLI